MSRTTPGERGATRDGIPCKKCGGTKRYTSNDNCVECMLKRSRDRRDAQAARRKAKNAAGGGLRIERQSPCGKCGSKRFYRTSGSCADCTLRRDAARRAGVDLDTHPDWAVPVRSRRAEEAPVVFEAPTLTGVRLKNRINEVRRLKACESMTLDEIAEHYHVTRKTVQSWIGGSAHV